MGDGAVALVERHWELMASNDYRMVGTVLADDFILEWPQSNERIRGRDNFAEMNECYPAAGRWQFRIHRLVGNETEVVTDVGVTDGVVSARAISFFTVREARISRLIEFWPENYPAPNNRSHLVEPIG